MYPKKYFEQQKLQAERGKCFVLMPFAGQYAEVYDTIVEAIEGPGLNFEFSRDVPFDLRHYRCTKYEQSKPGLRQLKKDLVSSAKEVAAVAYRFSNKRK
jgi:hypothetical protein